MQTIPEFDDEGGWGQLLLQSRASSFLAESQHATLALSSILTMYPSHPPLGRRPDRLTGFVLI